MFMLVLFVVVLNVFCVCCRNVVRLLVLLFCVVLISWVVNGKLNIVLSVLNYGVSVLGVFLVILLII